MRICSVTVGSHKNGYAKTLVKMNFCHTHTEQNFK
uniref:Uncharacterized protein n=1 Tax=Anguilla anguilla TaxID=7936 RepID=A0A0E9PFX7_ANGAN